MGKNADKWRELAKRDDVLEGMVPSDLRQLIAEVDAVETRRVWSIENLAAYAHDAWSGWMRYIFSKGELKEDGTFVMPKWAVDRWGRQMSTGYDELPEEEKKSDREEAKKIMDLIS